MHPAVVAGILAVVVMASQSCTATSPTEGTAWSAGSPEIRECGAPQDVTPATFASALEDGGCSTLVLAPGAYGPLAVSDRSGGVLTIRCQQPGTCVASDSRLSRVDGVIIDGLRFEGGGENLNIDKSMNVKVQNSSFNRASGAALRAVGRPTENTQILSNSIRNDQLGCNV